MYVYVCKVTIQKWGERGVIFRLVPLAYLSCVIDAKSSS